MLGIDQPTYLSNHGRAVGVPDGHHSVSLAAYLPADDGPWTRDALRAVARTAGIADEHVVHERYLHRMTVVSAVATAEQGGLAGDWVGARGHLVDAVLCSAEEAARAAVAHLERRPVLR